MYEHPSGLSGAYDRSPANPEWDGLVFREGVLGQATELNEMQSIMNRRSRRVGNLISRDGDRLAGAEAVINVSAGTVSLAAGLIYAQGDQRPVAAKVLSGVPMTGDVQIGVRLVAEYVTEEDDTALLGLHPGSESEGEAGAARSVISLQWSRNGDALPGQFITVYSLRNGTVVDTSPPAELSGVNAVVARYDRDSHGNYVVSGSLVTALGKTGDNQVFSISEGVANIYGFKRTRSAALRHEQIEEWDTEEVSTETRTFPATSPATIKLAHGPIAEINSIVITKQITETVTKGNSGTEDTLEHSSVTAVIEVKQGATVYNATTDYSVSNDKINWSPAGAEPATSSTYTVTYQYYEAIEADSTGTDTITISGGAPTSTVLVSYKWKLPRIDLLCLDQNGYPKYVKGIADRSSPQPPLAPMTLLPLAEIHNNYRTKPVVKNIGVRAYHFTKIQSMYERLVEMIDLTALGRLRDKIDQREPVAKLGVFVDPLIDNTYRDAGAVQNAAVFQGSMQLPITPTFFKPVLTSTGTLDYSDEVIVSQPIVTDSIKINPYNSYERLPCDMVLEPAVDFWVDQPEDDVSTNVVTQQITQDVVRRVTGSTNSVVVNTTVREQKSTADVLLSESVANAQFMRQIPVSIQVSGFGEGENLLSLYFGGVNVKPAGTQTADSNGNLTVNITIPAKMPAGRALVVANGQAGSFASALFVAAGYYDVDTIKKVTTIVKTIIRETVITSAPVFQGGQNSHGGGGNVDPVAQTFTLDEGRHISKVRVKFAAFGNKAKGLNVELVKTSSDGFPTGDVVAQAFVSLTSAQVNQWVEVPFASLPYVAAGVEHAFIFRTDDDNHALCIAGIGDLDPVKQQFLGAQPYSVGLLLSSANANTWTAHQREDLTFEIFGATFPGGSKTIALGNFAVSNCSDLKVLASVLLPEAGTSVVFEIERQSGAKTKLRPNQNWELREYLNETIKLRAILTGTTKATPQLFKGITLVAGSLVGSANYISRNMKIGTAVRLSTWFKALLPAGSAVAVQYDFVDNSWQSLSQTDEEVLDLGWVEREYRQDPITAIDGRLKITLTGTPAARPSIQDLRAWTV